MQRQFVLTIALTGFALAACSSPPAGGPVNATFLHRANDACGEALNTVGSQPFPYDTFDASNPVVSQLPAVGAYLDGIAFNHKEVAVMQAVGRPSRGTHTWSAFLTLVGQEQDAMQAQISAAKASDRAAFVSSVEHVHQIGTTIDSAAAQVGFAKSDSCVVLLGTPSA